MGQLLVSNDDRDTVRLYASKESMLSATAKAIEFLHVCTRLRLRIRMTRRREANSTLKDSVESAVFAEHLQRACKAAGVDIRHSPMVWTIDLKNSTRVLHVLHVWVHDYCFYVSIPIQKIRGEIGLVNVKVVYEGGRVAVIPVAQMSA